VRQEKRVAKGLGGHRKAASGATPTSKGDVSAKGFLIEAKTTEKDSFSLKSATLAKIDQEALGELKQPAVFLEFQNMKRPAPKEWVLIPASVFHALVDLI